MSQYFDWDASWTAIDTSLSISTGSTDTSDAISLDGKAAAEVSIECAYGATASTGLKVYICRDVDGTNYEAAADLPFGVVLAYSTSTTYRRTITIDAGQVGSFKILLSNASGATVTVTTRIRYAVVGSS